MISAAPKQLSVGVHIRSPSFGKAETGKSLEITNLLAITPTHTHTHRLNHMYTHDVIKT